MPVENLWQDPKTWAAIGGTGIGLCGFIYGMISNYWNRHESRLDALAKVLQPLTRAAQHLRKANKARQKCDQLGRSFPNPEAAREASKRLETFMAEYNEGVKDGEEQFRMAESEFHARSFRFPDKISLLTKRTFDALSEFGAAVNDGYFDKADIAFARFSDEFKAVRAAGRGWRLADPLEGIKKRFKKEKPEPPKPSPYELSAKEMAGVMELVNKRAISQAHNAFAVHPPRKLLEHPEIATSDRVIEELEDSVFYVVFQDGTRRLLSFAEFMCFTLQLIIIQSQMQDIAAMIQAAPPSGGRAEVSVKMNFSMTDLMRPETVKALLTKVNFSPIASDDGENGKSADLTI